ncbi:hypothetical protein HDU96_005942 [Phlyctochytrium bullatum]|nr:hypothetical protein HDU96_005942 [Phlyctochytrium bullatum]
MTLSEDWTADLTKPIENLGAHIALRLTEESLYVTQPETDIAPLVCEEWTKEQDRQQAAKNVKKKALSDEKCDVKVKSSEGKFLDLDRVLRLRTLFQSLSMLYARGLSLIDKKLKRATHALQRGLTQSTLVALFKARHAPTPGYKWIPATILLLENTSEDSPLSDYRADLKVKNPRFNGARICLAMLEVNNEESTNANVYYVAGKEGLQADLIKSTASNFFTVIPDLVPLNVDKEDSDEFAFAFWEFRNREPEIKPDDSIIIPGTVFKRGERIAQVTERGLAIEVEDGLAVEEKSLLIQKKEQNDRNSTWTGKIVNFSAKPWSKKERQKTKTVSDRKGSSKEMANRLEKRVMKAAGEPVFLSNSKSPRPSKENIASATKTQQEEASLKEMEVDIAVEDMEVDVSTAPGATETVQDATAKEMEVDVSTGATKKSQDAAAKEVEVDMSTGATAQDAAVEDMEVDVSKQLQNFLIQHAEASRSKKDDEANPFSNENLQRKPHEKVFTHCSNLVLQGGEAEQLKHLQRYGGHSQKPSYPSKADFEKFSEIKNMGLNRLQYHNLAPADAASVIAVLCLYSAYLRRMILAVFVTILVAVNHVMDRISVDGKNGFFPLCFRTTPSPGKRLPDNVMSDAAKERFQKLQGVTEAGIKNLFLHLVQKALELNGVLKEDRDHFGHYICILHHSMGGEHRGDRKLLSDKDYKIRLREALRVILELCIALFEMHFEDHDIIEFCRQLTDLFPENLIKGGGNLTDARKRGLSKISQSRKTLFKSSKKKDHWDSMDVRIPCLAVDDILVDNKCEPEGLEQHLWSVGPSCVEIWSILINNGMSITLKRHREGQVVKLTKLFDDIERLMFPKGDGEDAEDDRNIVLSSYWQHDIKIELKSKTEEKPIELTERKAKEEAEERLKEGLVVITNAEEDRDDPLYEEALEAEDSVSNKQAKTMKSKKSEAKSKDVKADNSGIEQALITFGENPGPMQVVNITNRILPAIFTQGSSVFKGLEEKYKEYSGRELKSDTISEVVSIVIGEIKSWNSEPKTQGRLLVQHKQIKRAFGSGPTEKTTAHIVVIPSHDLSKEAGSPDMAVEPIELPVPARCTFFTCLTKSNNEIIVTKSSKYKLPTPPIEPSATGIVIRDKIPATPEGASKLETVFFLLHVGKTKCWFKSEFKRSISTYGTPAADVNRTWGESKLFINLQRHVLAKIPWKLERYKNKRRQTPSHLQDAKSKRVKINKKPGSKTPVVEETPDEKATAEEEEVQEVKYISCKHRKGRFLNSGKVNKGKKDQKQRVKSMEPQDIEPVTDYPITFKYVGNPYKQGKRLPRCNVSGDAVVQLFEEKMAEEAGSGGESLSRDQVVRHIQAATERVIKYLKDRSKENAEVTVKDAFERNIVRILDEVDKARVQYIESKGLSAKKKLTSTPKEGFGSDVRVVYGGRGGVDERKRLSVDIGLQTLATVMADNGNTYYFGEDLWRFMCFVNDEKAFIQSQVDKRLDNLDCVRKKRVEIEEKLNKLTGFPNSQEEWDAWVKNLNKLHEELGKMKVRESENDAELLAWKANVKRMDTEVKDRITRLIDEISNFCCEYKLVIIPTYKNASSTKSRDSNIFRGAQGSDKSNRVRFDHGRLLQEITWKTWAAGNQVLVGTEAFTTQTCSSCLRGRRVGKAKVFHCLHCKRSFCRDSNACANIARDNMTRVLFHGRKVKAGADDDIAGYICQERTSHPPPKSMDELVNFFQKTEIGYASTSSGDIDLVASRGELELVKFLHFHVTGKNPFHITIPFLRTLQEIGYASTSSGDIDLVASRASRGELELVKFLHFHVTGAGCTTDAMDEAAARGQLDVVKFLHEHRSEGCTKYAMDQAAINENFEVVRFLHEHRSEGCTAVALNNAAKYDDTGEIVRLLVTRKESNLRTAFKAAARAGKARAVEILGDAIEEREGKEVLQKAVRGALQVAGIMSDEDMMLEEIPSDEELAEEQEKLANSVVGYLKPPTAASSLSMASLLCPPWTPGVTWSNQGGPCLLTTVRSLSPCGVELLRVLRTLNASTSSLGSVKTVETALRYGGTSLHIMIPFLRALQETGYAIPSRSDIDLVASRGELELVKFLHFHVAGAGCTTDAMDEAAARGQLDVVKFLHEHRSEGCSTKAVDRAAANNELEMVLFLLEHRSEGCSTKAVDRAAANNELEMVLFLLEHRSEGCSEVALNKAAKYDDTGEIVRLLVTRKESNLLSAFEAAARAGKAHAVEILGEAIEGREGKEVLQKAVRGALKVAGIMSHEDMMLEDIPSDEELAEEQEKLANSVVGYLKRKLRELSKL